MPIVFNQVQSIQSDVDQLEELLLREHANDVHFAGAILERVP